MAMKTLCGIQLNTPQIKTYTFFKMLCFFDNCLINYSTEYIHFNFFVYLFYNSLLKNLGKIFYDNNPKFYQILDLKYYIIWLSYSSFIHTIFIYLNCLNIILFNKDANWSLNATFLLCVCEIYIINKYISHLPYNSHNWTREVMGHNSGRRIY